MVLDGTFLVKIPKFKKIFNIFRSASPLSRVHSNTQLLTNNIVVIICTPVNELAILWNQVTLSKKL